MSICRLFANQNDIGVFFVFLFCEDAKYWSAAKKQSDQCLPCMLCYQLSYDIYSVRR